MNPNVRDVFDRIDFAAVAKYRHYWGGLTVSNHADFFRRWLFAFCSVHTTWERNVVGYNALKDLAWMGDDAELLGRLKTARCGLYNNRTKYISAFATDFWTNTQDFYRGTDEPWRVYRDRLEERVLGLGPAKTSFALELSFPLDADVACLDVHMLRLYGKKNQSLRVNEYATYEADWVGRSRGAGVDPYVARMVYWDKLQNNTDSRYWSGCLE